MIHPIVSLDFLPVTTKPSLNTFTSDLHQPKVYIKPKPHNKDVLIYDQLFPSP